MYPLRQRLYNRKKIIKILRQPIDLKLLVDLSVHHAVFHLVYRSLSQISHPSIPNTVIEELKTATGQNSMWMSLLSAELVRLLDLMQGRNIRVINLKGPALAVQLYGDYIQRASQDFDLMVSQEEVIVAEDILLQAGYKRIFPDIGLKPVQYQHLRKSYHFHHKYQHITHHITVELHWRLDFVSLLKFDFESLWLKTSRININNSTISVLSAEDTFFYLILHGARHGWCKLQWLLDISELIKKEQKLDWNGLATRSKQLGVEDLMGQVSALSNSYLGIEIPIPEHPTEKAVKLAETASRILLDPYRVNNYFIKLIYHYRIYGYKLMLKRLFSPDHRVYSFISLPDILHPLYYIINPFYRLFKFIMQEFQK